LGAVNLELIDSTGTPASVGNAALSGTLPTLSSVALVAGASKTYTIKLRFDTTGSTAGDNAIQNCKATFQAAWTLDQRAATTSTNGSAS
jgi:hypothetical protein